MKSKPPNHGSLGRMKRAFHCFVLAFLLGTTGCVAISDRSMAGGSRPFAGTRAHGETVTALTEGKAPWYVAFWAFDFPFSFVFDILALPYDLAQ